MSRIACIVLAAGRSARLGRPKQLLPYRGTTLVRWVVTAALEAGLDPVNVVIGSDAPRMRAELAGLGVTIVENQLWELGMGTSIRAGVQALPDATGGVMVTSCDQPHVSVRHFGELVRIQAETGRAIAASRYGQTVGVPALFMRAVFPELLTLGDTTGAKPVIARDPNCACTVDFPGGEFDIDTEADYRRLIAGA